MAPDFKKFIAPAEIPGLVPSPHRTAKNCLECQLRRILLSNAFLGYHMHTVHGQTCRQNTHKIKKSKHIFFKK